MRHHDDANPPEEILSIVSVASRIWRASQPASHCSCERAACPGLALFGADRNSIKWARHKVAYTTKNDRVRNQSEMREWYISMKLAHPDQTSEGSGLQLEPEANSVVPCGISYKLCCLVRYNSDDAMMLTSTIDDID